MTSNQPCNGGICRACESPPSTKLIGRALRTDIQFQTFQTNPIDDSQSHNSRDPAAAPGRDNAAAASAEWESNKLSLLFPSHDVAFLPSAPLWALHFFFSPFTLTLKEIWFIAQGDAKQTSSLVVLFRFEPAPAPPPTSPRHPEGPPFLVPLVHTVRHCSLFSDGGARTHTHHITFKRPFSVSQQIKVILQ